MKPYPLRILLVENDQEDLLITQMVLKQVKVPNRLFVVKDGQEALDFLYQRGKYSRNGKAAPPNLILLGIDLPKVNGIEVLRRLKSDENLKKIPIIIVTRSGRQEDVRASYELGVNSYIQKPQGFDQFVRAIRFLYQYWSVLAKLPS